MRQILSMRQILRKRQRGNKHILLKIFLSRDITNGSNHPARTAQVRMRQRSNKQIFDDIQGKGYDKPLQLSGKNFYTGILRMRQILRMRPRCNKQSFDDIQGKGYDKRLQPSGMNYTTRVILRMRMTFNFICTSI
jgi:hypothetical protein